MKLKVKGLVTRKTAAGIALYWIPNPRERQAGWKSLPLGLDLVEAVKRAEARNAEVEAWRVGGAKPKAVKKYIAARTLSDIIARYRREKLGTMAKSTQRTAETPIKRLEVWAGDMKVEWITRKRVKALRIAMTKPLDQGGIGHHAAFAVLDRGRQIFTWAVDDELVSENPFLRFGLSKPAPRSVIWEDRHIRIFDEAAIKLKMPSIGLAIELGIYNGQREADILKMNRTSWREIPRQKFHRDPALWDALVSNDGPDAGKVMGIYIRQGKTNRWVGIPVEGTMRHKIETVLATANKQAVASTSLVTDERTGMPWSQDAFIHAIIATRKKAIELAQEREDEALAKELAEIQFRDLRRSCVVWLGELGLEDSAISAITGHSLKTIQEMLEIYMPRTEAMAARAVVARLPVKKSINIEEQSG